MLFPEVSVIILAGGLSRRMGQDKALLPGRGGRPLLCQTVETARQLFPKIVASEIVASEIVASEIVAPEMAAPEILIVTPWPDRYRSVLLASNLASGVRFVQERCDRPSKGPLGGFAQGWAQVSSEWCLLLACDLPYLEALVLRQWWQSVGALAEAPAGEGGLSQPVMASLVPFTDRYHDSPYHGSHDHGSHHQSAPGHTVSGHISGRISGHISGHKGDKRWEPLCGFYHRRCLPSLHRYLAGGGRSFQRWLTDVPVAPFYGVPDTMLFNCNTPADWATVSL